MKFFADASFLGNAYYPGGDFAASARHIRKRLAGHLHYSVMVRMEFRLGSLWSAGRLDGWEEFLADEAAGKAILVSVDWDALINSAETQIVRHGAKAKPDLLDALHVLAAVKWGATHFLSYDKNLRQRAFARACGLKVLPTTLPNEH